MNYRFLQGAHQLCVAEVSDAWFKAAFDVLLTQGSDAWSVWLKGA